jgi:hypothetical protein
LSGATTATAPPQVAPKLCTGDIKLGYLECSIWIAHNALGSSSVNDLHFFSF